MQASVALRPWSVIFSKTDVPLFALAIGMRYHPLAKCLPSLIKARTVVPNFLVSKTSDIAIPFDIGLFPPNFTYQTSSCSKLVESIADKSKYDLLGMNLCLLVELSLSKGTITFGMISFWLRVYMGLTETASISVDQGVLMVWTDTQYLLHSGLNVW